MADNKYSDADIISLTNRVLGLGSGNSGSYSIFRGLNALGGIPALPHNTDDQGLVFLTKPALNLSYQNVIGIRKMVYLTDYNAYSMGNVIRCMLNPPFFDPHDSDNTDLSNNTRSAIIDDKCAFLPISNLLLSMSAPPDIVADTYTSNEGYAKEQVSWIDGKPFINNVYDLSLTFANMEGDPLTTIFTTWVEYAQFICEGRMIPYPAFIIANEIDYQTRIWRLVLDRSKTFVQDIYACGAAFPTTSPIGGKFGFTRDQHINPEANQLQINFRCIGAMYNDPILITEFNNTVVTFNADMADNVRSANMTQIKGVDKLTGFSLKNLFNFRMYPYIASNMELQWYASNTDYNLIMNMIQNISSGNIQVNSLMTSDLSKATDNSNISKVQDKGPFATRK